RGDLRRLPRGATPLDFAYLVHTEVGHHCVGSKVNGRIVPLRYELRSGDTVQIITSPLGKPNRDWLKLVKSPNARSKIRHWLKTSEQADSVALGKEMLERELRRRRLSPPAETPLERLAETPGYPDVDPLMGAPGRGSVSISSVIQRWFPQGVGLARRRRAQRDRGREESVVVNLSNSGVDRRRRRADVRKAIATTHTAARTGGIEARDRDAEGGVVLAVRELSDRLRVMRAVERVG